MQIKIPKKYKYVVGADEVGRGPIAGPVTIGVVATELRKKICKHVDSGKKKIELRDSKKMTPKNREVWFEYIKSDPAFFYAVACVPAKTIDEIGIVGSIRLATKRALKKLEGESKIDCRNSFILLDGSLLAPDEYPQETVIKGDDKIPIISAASVMAKVTRDKKMVDYHNEFPSYGFCKHKGYGTKLHYEMIDKNGLCYLHRRSYLKKIVI